jgi:2-keto-3-deoxy-L-rhamnonate aldolase RhmA
VSAGPIVDNARALRSRLASGDTLFGPLVFELAAPGLAAVFADVGFDFLLVDLEHAPVDPSSVARMMLVGNQIGLPTIVKLPDLERSMVQRYLDYGAVGIQIPHVEEPEELRLLSRWMRYPPDGERGQVFGLGNTAFRSVDNATHVREANANLFAVPMIETRLGVERVDAILDAGGVDLLFIGTGDLSSSLGVPGQMTHPVVEEAVRRVIAACQTRAIPVAINAETPEAARRWIDIGARAIAYSSELGMIRAHSRALLAPFRRS